MRFVVAGILLLLAHPALAQQSEYTIKLSVQDINVLSNALGQRPFVEVVGLINKLQAQVNAQDHLNQPHPHPDPLMDPPK